MFAQRDEYMSYLQLLWVQIVEIPPKRLMIRLAPNSMVIRRVLRAFVSFALLSSLAAAQQSGAAGGQFPALLGLAVIASAVACGGGSGGGGGGGENPGTPVGNYPGLTVSVTINGITQSINNLSVNVQ